MKKIHLTITLFLAFLTTAMWAQDAREISQKALDVTDINAMEMISTLKIMDAKSHERVRTTTTASKKFGTTTKIITKFISPAEVKGTGLLVYDYEDKDDDMWIYLPAIRKVRRIVSSEKGKSFMGSEFSNADMSKPNLNDYTYKLLGTEEYNGKACWKIESTPLNDDIAYDNGFSRKIALIDKNSHFTYKVIYYDLNDELHKEMIISNYKEVGNGKYLARNMEMDNLQNGRKSILTIDKLQNGSNLSENNFTPAALEK